MHVQEGIQVLRADTYSAWASSLREGNALNLWLSATEDCLCDGIEARSFKGPGHQVEVEQVFVGRSVSSSLIEHVVEKVSMGQSTDAGISSSLNAVRHKRCHAVLQVGDTKFVHIRTTQPEFTAGYDDSVQLAEKGQDFRLQIQVFDHVIAHRRLEDAGRPGKPSRGQIDVALAPGQVDIQPAVHMNPSAPEMQAGHFGCPVRGKPGAKPPPKALKIVRHCADRLRAENRFHPFFRESFPGAHLWLSRTLRHSHQE